MRDGIKYIAAATLCGLLTSPLGAEGRALPDAEPAGELSSEEALTPRAEGNNKFWTPRSTVPFSPRWANRINGTDPLLTPDDYMEVADGYQANGIVWHYPQTSGVFDSALLIQAQQRNYSTFNCALPATTRIADNAVQDTAGNPVPLPGSQITFRPNTETSGFRQEVTDFLFAGRDAGCESLQQDDPYFMFTCREGEFCMRDLPGENNDSVKAKVHDFYTWLEDEIVSVFGYDVPRSFNKQLVDAYPNNASSNDLIPYHDTAMSEVFPEQNYPEFLFNALHVVNNLTHNLTTVSTLRDDSRLYNRRHIATVYALSGHPIIPFDVFVGSGEPRFDGTVSDFAPYYDLVREHRSLFDGHGVLDVYIQHWQNTAGIVRHQGWLKGVDTRYNQMAVLRGNTDTGSRVLHVLNWQVADQPRFFTYWIDKSQVPFTPTRALVHRPLEASFEVDVVDGGLGRWKLTVSGVYDWAVAELLP